MTQSAANTKLAAVNASPVYETTTHPGASRKYARGYVLSGWRCWSLMLWLVFWGACWGGACTSSSFGQEEVAVEQAISHSDLSVYRSASGELQPIESIEDWKKRRQQIIAGAELAMGPMPSMEQLPAFDVKITEDTRMGDVRRLTLTIAVEEADRLPLDLYLPKSMADVVDVNDIFRAVTPPNDTSKESPKLAAIVALHPTGALGKRIVAGEGPRDGRQYALELAQRGYVVVAPDYPSFGQYADYDFDSDRYVSGTMKGIFNHRRCVDLLTQLKFVDADRIGAIGHSLGGHNAIFLGVFDERVKAIVSSCGWCPFHDYYGGDIKGWASDRYMPRLRDVYHLDPDEVPFDFYELVAALAPRTFVSASPLHDSNFDVAGVRKAIPVARSIYALWGVPDELILLTPDCDHNFPDEIRLQTYEVLDRVLKHDPVDGE